MTFVPTRAAGLSRLVHFVEHAGTDYAATRNFDHGPNDRGNVSRLSPYLRYRFVTEEEVINAVRTRHSGAAGDRFVQEVLWRSYWKAWLELRPTVWSDYRADLARLDDGGGGWRRDHARALAGTTGIDCFDAWIGELATHGYLHNHARMWFASIWIFTLRLPWQLGAALFWHHLYDGGPASNTLSWRWVAGLQTAGKTYLAQADNIARYTGSRFRPIGLATVATPVVAPPPPAPVMPPPSASAPNGRVGLIVAEDDLLPESLALAGGEVAAVACLGRDGERAATVEAFITHALDDARHRAGERYGVPASILPAATASAIAAWAEAHRIDTVVIARPPVGPGADAMTEIAERLEHSGVAVHAIVRDWDRRCWPHATRGFFAFREHVRQ